MTNSHEIRFARSRFPIWEAPAGILIPAVNAICVSIGARFVAISNTHAITTVPTISAQITFPLDMAVIRQTMNGITARSANGSSLFPGSTIAKRIVIGTSRSPTAITDGSPRETAASSPMKISLSQFSPAVLLL